MVQKFQAVRALIQREGKEYTLPLLAKDQEILGLK